MTTQSKYSYFHKNGLSIVLVLCMLLCLLGQFFTGWSEKNNQRTEQRQTELSIIDYATSGHFLQATFENWESEFLQMALYVLLTVSLRQQGSSESKKLQGKEEVDREPKVHKDAPWPVRKGGIWLKLYCNSLSIAFTILFCISFLFHFWGSLIEQNEENVGKGLPVESCVTYIMKSRFWFESFQNWQSEFLAVVSIVILSIWLRQKGSPESKPVDASYKETGS